MCGRFKENLDRVLTEPGLPVRWTQHVRCHTALQMVRGYVLLQYTCILSAAGARLCVIIVYMYMICSWCEAMCYYNIHVYDLQLVRGYVLL